MIDNLVQRKQNRHLNQQCTAASCRGDTVFLINCHGLFRFFHLRSLVFFVLIFLFNSLQIRLHYAHHLRHLLLLDLKRRQNEINDNRIQNNRNTDVRNSNFFQTKINSIDQPAEDLAYPPDNRPR